MGFDSFSGHIDKILVGQRRDQSTLGQPEGSEARNSAKLEKSVGFQGFPASVSGQNLMEMVKKEKEVRVGKGWERHLEGQTLQIFGTKAAASLGALGGV